MIGFLTSCSTKTIWKNWHISYNDWTYPVLTKGMTREVTFTESCKYDIGKQDQKDYNKLFGYSFGLLPVIHNGKIYRPSHYNSVRIGWRWNPKLEKIEIAAYYYINGESFYPEKTGEQIVVIGELNKKYVMSIIRLNGEIIYYLDDVEFLRKPLQSNKKVGFKLCFFFGGNKPNPGPKAIKCRIE